MKKNKIGIIGNGFVGEAQAFAFSTIADIFIYDIDPLKINESLNLSMIVIMSLFVFQLQ